MRALLEAVARRDRDGAIRWIGEPSGNSPLSLLELADVIAMCVGWLIADTKCARAFNPACDTQAMDCGSRATSAPGPERDRSRRRSSNRSLRHSGRRAAYSRSSIDRRLAGTPRRSYLKKLIRRVSPTLRIHDLGRTTYEVQARREVPPPTRRKALALLLYLVSRSRQTATREQVMDELWPNQTPKSAINSLHQTLFISFGATSTPGTTAAPRRTMCALEARAGLPGSATLFQVDSVAFMRQASEITGIGTSVPHWAQRCSAVHGAISRLSSSTRNGQTDWRTLLHAAVPPSLPRDGRVPPWHRQGSALPSRC